MLKCLKNQRYNIGIIKQDINTILSRGIKKGDITWLNHNYKDRFFADPFCIKCDNEKYYILCEEYIFDEGIGKITLLVVDKKTFSLLERKTLIEESTHMSFPFCLLNSKEVYPENSSSGSYYKYVLSDDYKEIIKKEMIINEPLIDCVHIIRKNKKIMYATTINNPNGELIEYSFKNNSIKKRIIFSNNNTMARSAGLFFYIGKELYRPAQVCNKRYGEQTTIQKIEYDKNGEILIKSIITLNAFENKEFGQTLHTFNVYDNYIIVDGSRDFFITSPKQLYRRIVHLIKNHKRK